MKKNLIILFLFLCFFAKAQNEQLANNYFDRGEFEKALVSYEELLKAQVGNSNYFQRVIECYQQLQQYDKAEKAILERLDKYRQSNLLIELGYNYQLQKDDAKATKYYDQAIEKIKSNANEVYGIAYVFERKALVDYALLAYQTALTKEPKMSFNFQMALLYGQKGNTDLMIETFLAESYQNPQNLPIIQNQLSRFMTEDADENFNNSLRKALLLRTQKTQDVFWNDFLSWYYVQLKEYGKAFIQQKAIYKRNPESFSNIVNLAQMAIEDKDNEAAKEILTFVLDNTNDLDLLIQAHSYLVEMKIDNATEKDYPAITQELDLLLKEFGISPYTLSLLKLDANFSAFHLKNTEKAKTILKNAMDMPLNKYQMAEVKMDLADILLYEEKFNQALIYYSQIENDLSGDVVGQEASLKTAKTSYYKTDFEWASHQLKVLKSASTQLIANDALDLFLLISDNTVEDSTQVALKKFARGDFLLYQNKKQEALSQFQLILKEHKGEEIEPVTLLRIGKIYEKLGDYTKALENYSEIITNHKDAIYVDEALYFSADIYNLKLNDAEKAKPLYEEMIFKHEDSIYYVDSRKKYRQLRGDNNL
ncbi:tetratricopeptide repeat protein [Flavobacterium capsici]|uniref:Tetratricopeptide repeat protein n=1 Tax=Flavobacterium capsici TaxID=3075618 RepID=A0AA96EZJ5_9FLAO|nr:MULTISPECIES: tetratricopeptide repeat protein [unclassified Flavobacterium]WNM19825.1 tetratricopeptide repeat protein [Flavobacterium sp. PMR2A8]WNM21214.1 tetratricopeptide repeat protein [Flavobacterium sp. PMTSA4]